MGYHAEPFFDRLHLHVVSEDLRGHGLKNKQHYNSFTTPFFMTSKGESIRYIFLLKVYNLNFFDALIFYLRVCGHFLGGR